MEVVEPLLRVAEEIFRRRDFGRVSLRLGDGWYGWPEAAPFDAMLIKESATHVPPPLLAQLRPGGRMVIPLGPPEGEQWLTLVTRRADGPSSERAVLPVRFAPFQGGERIVAGADQRIRIPSTRISPSGIGRKPSSPARCA